MRITHHGHACVLVETGGARVLIDPGNFSRGLDKVAGVDLVVMTHQHADHADPDQLRTVLAASPDARVAAEAQTAASITEQTGGELRPEALESGQTLDVGDASVQMVGELHAFNSEFVPRVGNLGALVSAPGQPRLFHPGDAYDVDPGDVDVLALPLSAPWCAVRETLAFVRTVEPRHAFPIHDALLSEAGRSLYLHHVRTFGGEGLEVHDLADGTPRDF